MQAYILTRISTKDSIYMMIMARFEIKQVLKINSVFPVKPRACIYFANQCTPLVNIVVLHY